MGSRAQLLRYQLVASASTGTLIFTATADFDVWPLAWVALVPLLFVIESSSSWRQAALFGWLAGLVANLGGFYWVAGLLERFGHFSWPVAGLGLVALASYQALVYVFFAVVIRALREQSRRQWGTALPMALLAPLALVTFELLVPFLFPWYLAITQAWQPTVIQVAELTGPLGVSALLAMTSGALFDASQLEGRRRRRIVAISAAVLMSTIGVGSIRRSGIRQARSEAAQLQVGIVQPNVPFDEKGVDKRAHAAAQLSDLQERSSALEAMGADLLVWPESAYPYALPRDLHRDFRPGHAARIRRGFRIPLVFGAITRDPDPPPFNSALLLEPSGALEQRFDKNVLLAFGEYVPFGDTFPWLATLIPPAAGVYQAGDKAPPFVFEHDGAHYRIGPMICYEDILPSFGRRLAAAKPHLLVNVTNDAWFGDTSEPWQHFALSVFRAVELRTDLVRSVNTGVSGVVAADGTVTARTYAVDPQHSPRGVDGLVANVALLEGGDTVYARVGDLFGWLCAMATLLMWVVWPRVRRDR